MDNNFGIISLVLGFTGCFGIVVSFMAQLKSIYSTRNLLEIAREWESIFIFFSSSEIYGNPDVYNIPTQETYKGYVACQGPRCCYDESKRLGETLCYVYNE